jgi:hypothetical protein
VDEIFWKAGVFALEGAKDIDATLLPFEVSPSCHNSGTPTTVRQPARYFFASTVSLMGALINVTAPKPSPPSFASFGEGEIHVL